MVRERVGSRCWQGRGREGSAGGKGERKRERAPVGKVGKMRGLLLVREREGFTVGKGERRLHCW